jgi:transposase-like protein
VVRALPTGPDNLSERERKVVEHLAAGLTIVETARKVGVCEKTVYNYRVQKRIQQAIFARQTELYDATGGAGLSLLPDVVKVLTNIVNDRSARDSDRIAAGKTLMTAANEYQARRQLLRQITDLEERLYGVDEAAQQDDAVDAAAEPVVDSEALPPRRAARRRSE